MSSPGTALEVVDHTAERDIRSHSIRPSYTRIFNRDGPGLVDDLATVVAQHTAPLSVPAKPRATHECVKEWEPSQAIIELFLNPPDDPAMYPNFGQCPPVPIVVNCTRCGQDHPESNACDAELKLLEELTRRAKTARAPVKRNNEKSKVAHKKPEPEPKPRSTLIIVLTANDTTIYHKKTARTEAQRLALLKADPWTLKVEPHYVVCRSCKHTISLDKRSRYYPGLWEKHRVRCVTKRVSSGFVDNDSVKAKTPPEPGMEHSFQAMPPVANVVPHTSWECSCSRDPV
ncbi:hypothetical protein DFH06DRAFT_1347139 [Mycena polygramma]|nr:hypothetical protein DFH06DRAFT_1347139 [Mycena polygramma]